MNLNRIKLQPGLLEYHFFVSWKALEYSNGAVVLDYSANCHRLAEGALSVYDLHHWRCYQKDCCIVSNNVLSPPLLSSCTFLKLSLILFLEPYQFVL